MTLDQNDSQALVDAVHVLESPGLAVHIAEIIGKPIQYGVGYLPDAARPAPIGDYDRPVPASEWRSH